MQHRDWETGRGTTAGVRVVPRPHPYGLVPKSGGRRVFIGSPLDQLYSDYVWWLCELGADAAVDDWDSAYIFCNVRRSPLFKPLRPESVYAHLASVKRREPKVPPAMTPHWFRHTRATALLLAGTPLHVVSRRLGHRSGQTTTTTYAHVTAAAELAALFDWAVWPRGGVFSMSDPMQPNRRLQRDPRLPFLRCSIRRSPSASSGPESSATPT